MIGTRHLERFMSEAERRGAKVVMVGDPEQLQAIEAGAAWGAVGGSVLRCGGGKDYLRSLRRPRIVESRYELVERIDDARDGIFVMWGVVPIASACDIKFAFGEVRENMLLPGHDSYDHAVTRRLGMGFDPLLYRRALRNIQDRQLDLTAIHDIQKHRAEPAIDRSIGGDIVMRAPIYDKSARLGQVLEALVGEAVIGIEHYLFQSRG